MARIRARLANRLKSYDRLIDYTKIHIGDTEAQRVMVERERLAEMLRSLDVTLELIHDSLN